MIRRTPAGPDDKEFVLGLRFSPEMTRGALSRNGYDQEQWWQAVQHDTWIVKQRRKSVGYLIIKPASEVSIVLTPEARGQGIGAKILKQIRAQDLVAFIRAKNAASIQAFTHAGFIHDKGRSDCEVYVKRQE